MRFLRFPSIAAFALVACAAIASGCFLLTSPESRFYTLAPAPAACSGRPTNLRVGVGPLSFPGYLQQASLATRVDPTQVEYAPRERWAEPLRDQFLRTFSADLGRCLGTEQIVAFPWYPTTLLDVAVRLDVIAFEVDLAGVAHLKAAWTVRHPHTDALRRSSSARLSEAARAATTDAKVEALSRLVGQLAQRIAADLRQPG